MIGKRFCAQVEAKYSKSRLPLYENNPLILALGDLIKEKNLFDVLSRAPKYDPASRRLSPEERLHLLPDLMGLVYPLEDSYTLCRKIAVMARHGLKDRNPLDGSLQQRLLALDELPPDLRKLDPTKRTMNNALSGLMTGISGMGKSTIMDVILDTFRPGVYVHHEFNGKPFQRMQVPFVVVENDPKGSLIGLLESILDELGRLSGDDLYMDLRKNYTLHDLIPHTIRQLLFYSVSMVIVDEAEYIKAQFNGGDAGMVFTWINLMNTSGVPLLLVANPEIEDVFNKWLKAGMRFSAGCRLAMYPLPRGQEYDEFLDAGWAYQWTKKKTLLEGNPYEEQLRAEIHYHAQGIPRLTLDLLRWTQELAIIRGGNETITPRLVQEAAERNGHDIQETMRVLASKIPKLMEKFRDLGLPPPCSVVNDDVAFPFTPKVDPQPEEPKVEIPKMRRGKLKPTGYLSYLDVRVRGDYSTYAIMKEDGIIGDSTDFWLS